MVEQKIGLIVPFYNHGQFAQKLLKCLHAYNVPIIVVDDGSGEQHQQQLKQAIDWAKSEYKSDITLFHCKTNQGKGAAMHKGFELANQKNLTHVIQVDADCQHDLTQIPVFIEACLNHPDALICGYPRYDKTVPKSRLIPRYLTHFWVWVHTLSFDIKDTLCGFRCYPVNPTMNVFKKNNIAKRMDFDIDIAVRMYWEGLTILNLPVGVTYHQDRSSHFQLWSDNVLITRIHIRLFFGMLYRMPRLLIKKIK